MKVMLHHFFIVCFILLAGTPLGHADPRDPLVPIQTSPENMELSAVGTLTEVVRADQIKLSNGKTYVLDNIRIPAHMESSVRSYLEKNFVGQKIGIFSNPELKNARVDEKGNMQVHVMTEAGRWIQGSLVSKGLAWAYSTPTNRDLVLPLYILENTARASKFGMWRDPDYAIRTDETIENSAGSFQLYQGIVKDVRIKEGFVYINFGADQSKDFTILIKHMDLSNPKIFEKSYDVQKLRNMIVRVRGWIEPNESGPLVYVTHQEQIEVLGVDPRSLVQKCVAGPGQYCPDQQPPPVKHPLAR